MSKIALLVANEKGGVGKSTFACAWLDLARYRFGKKIAAFDGDAKVYTLLDLYGAKGVDSKPLAEQDPCTGVAYFNIMDEYELDFLLNALDAGGDAILMDTPAGALDQLDRPLGSGTDLFKEYRGAGYEPVLVTVIDGSEPAARSLRKAVRKMGDTVKYVVIKNHRAVGPSGFTYFEDLAQAAVSEVGGVVLEMGDMRAEVYKSMLAQKMPISLVAKSQDLPRSVRTTISYWLDRLAAQVHGTIIDPEQIG